MIAVLFWTFVAAVVIGCGIDRHDRRKFEKNARRDLTPVPMDRLDREIQAVFAEDVIAEINEAFFLAEWGIDMSRTAGGFR